MLRKILQTLVQLEAMRNMPLNSLAFRQFNGKSIFELFMFDIDNPNVDQDFNLIKELLIKEFDSENIGISMQTGELYDEPYHLLSVTIHA